MSEHKAIHRIRRSLAPRRADIDLIELEKLCQLQCTDEEIGAWFGVATRTIERRRKEPEFAEVMLRGKAKGRISVRRMQMKLLEQGNATMGVWLGKQLLGQVEQGAAEVRPVPRLRDLSVEELNEVLHLYAQRYPELADEVAAIDAQFSEIEELPVKAALPAPRKPNER